MKSRSLSRCFALAGVIALFGCTAETEKELDEAAESVRQDINQGIVNVTEEVQEAIEGDEPIDEVDEEARLERLRLELVELGEELSELGKAAGENLKEAYAELEAKRADIVERVRQGDENGPDSSFVDDVEDAIDDIRKDVQEYRRREADAAEAAETPSGP